ncbi:MAG: hypothetical protein GY953_22090, partial [bacterium]|nr:hypothetical protein [bacterium]
FIVAILTAGLLSLVVYCITILLTIPVVVSLFTSGRSIVVLLQDLMAGTAAYIDGRVTISRAEEKGLGLNRFYGEKRVRCWYVVRSEYFEVDEEACKALPEGKYRLYYTPKSKLLLSLEPAPSS